MNFLQSLDNTSADKPIKRTNNENISAINRQYDPKQCPFAPAISNNSRILMQDKSIKPIHDRFVEVIEEKNLKLKEAQKKKQSQFD
jgi:hypothetical protein